MRFSRILVLSFATVLMLTSCSNHSTSPTTTNSDSISSSTASPIDINIEKATEDLLNQDMDTPTGFESLNESAWEPLHFHAVYPQMKNADAFNETIKQDVKDNKKEFEENYPNPTEESIAIPEFTQTWIPLINNSNILGVRILTTEFGGASQYLQTKSLYSNADGSQIWTGDDLISADSQAQAIQALKDAAEKKNKGEEVSTDLKPQDFFKDFSFNSTGDAQIVLPKGELAPADLGNVLVTIPAEIVQSWLSDTGKEIQEASKKVSPQSSDKTNVSPSNSATNSKVDCQKEKCLALTFDDGPGPYTQQIVDDLVSHKAKATFFVIGRNVAVNPETVQYAYNHGMEIGNHTWSHPSLDSLPSEAVMSELSKTTQAIEVATGAKPVGVRPPYGAFSKATPHDGMPFYLWDIDSEDWKNRDANLTMQRVTDAAHPGGIVLMHDIHPSTAKALPGIIEQLQEDGYTLVTASELIGDTVESSGAYYSAQ